MRSRLIRPPGASSLVLLGVFSIGAAHAGIAQQNSGYAPGIGAAPEARIGCVEAIDGEGVLFVAFVLFVVSMIVL